MTPVGCGPPATRGRYAYFRGDETWPRWLLRPQPRPARGMQSESGRNGSYSSIVASGSDLGVRLKLNRLVDHLWPTMAVMTALL